MGSAAGVEIEALPENLPCLLNLSEDPLGRLVSGVLVRVVLLRQPPMCCSHVVQCCVAPQAQHFVGVSVLHPPLRRLGLLPRFLGLSPCFLGPPLRFLNLPPWVLLGTPGIDSF